MNSLVGTKIVFTVYNLCAQSSFRSIKTITFLISKSDAIELNLNKDSKYFQVALWYLKYCKGVKLVLCASSMNPKLLYQNYLKEELKRRKAKNSSYSLRAYARDLGIPSAKLSQYLAGTCGISGKKAAVLAAKLRLSSLEVELFVCAAEAAHSRDVLSKKLAKEKLEHLLAGTFSQLNVEKFKLIQDWYHLAILELMELKGFQSDNAWIAKTLGISTEQAKSAVQRLERVQLLDRSQQPWQATHKDLETPPETSSRAIREYHRQMMGVVESRFEAVPMEKRELGSVVVAMDQELVPEFKQLLRRFQKEAAALAERSQHKNSLYALNFQFMPLYEGEIL